MKDVNYRVNTPSSYLSDLGLSPDEADMYTLLLSEGSLTARVIGMRLGIIVNSVYRSTKALLELGLIKELDVVPKQFQAVSPRVALEQLADKRIARIEQASHEAIRQLSSKQNKYRLNMDLMTGRQELFERFVKLAKNSKEETLVISIGELVPDSIWDVTKKSLARGVEQKFIFHKWDKQNIMLIRRWKAMGVDVRHVPNEGYHLNIFDRSAAIISASNAVQSKERTGVVIYNEAIIEVLRTYFYQQWAQAYPGANNAK